MKYSYVALLALSGLAAAQNSLPECSQKCIADSVAANTSCGSSDLICQCATANKAAIQGGATSCVITACGADKALEVLAAANADCDKALAETTSAAAATTSSAAAETSSAAAETSSAAAETTSSAAAVETTSSVVASASAAPIPSSNGTAVVPSPTPTPTEFPGTAAQIAVSFGSIFAVGMAVLAAF